MTIEQQRKDAIADFQALVIEEWEIGAALTEAATSNGLKPGVLESLLSREMSIDDLVEKVRREAAYSRFLAVATIEVDKVEKRTGVYSEMNLSQMIQVMGGRGRIRENIEATIARELSNHEVCKIRDMLKMKLLH